MKTQSEMRLECIKLASMLATAKLIPPGQVVPIAMEYLKWIDGDEALANASDMHRLVRKFSR